MLWLLFRRDLKLFTLNRLLNFFLNFDESSKDQVKQNYLSEPILFLSHEIFLFYKLEIIFLYEMVEVMK